MKPMIALVCALALLASVAECLAVLPTAVDQTANNVVRVKVGSSLASGVYIGRQYVLTARHLFDGEGTSQATATFRVGNEAVSGRLISAIDSDWDSAVIRLDREPTTPVAALTVSRDVQPGDMLWVAGYSSGELQYRHGPAKGFRRITKDPTGPAWYVHFEAPCYGGDSGGPVFREDGTLVGTMWGSGGGCGNEAHRTYTIALCARFTRRLVGALFPGLKRDCPSGGCPNNPSGVPGEQPIAPWDSPDMPQQPPPIVPETPPSVDLAGVLAELAALREAVENIQLQPGEKGDQGDQGPPGNDGADGADGVSPVIDYDQLAAEVLQRLPPVRLQKIDAEGVVLAELSEPLGKPLKLRFTPVTSAAE
jgi:hypothetical protein